MKKYTIELSEEQMHLVASCLEDVSRFASGQCEMKNTIEAMVKEFPFDLQIEKKDLTEEYLKQTKRVLMPDMPDNGSKGYNGTEFIGNTYQIYRTILYQLAKDKNWNNVYSSPALKSGNMGTVKIKSLNQSESGNKIKTDVNEQNDQPCDGNCGMNYCDTNGCIDRKRILTDPKPLEY